MPKKKLKTHYLDHSELEPRTLCGKAIDHITGSPLNGDGSVPISRVVGTAANVTCSTCIQAIVSESKKNNSNTQAPEGA